MPPSLVLKDPSLLHTHAFINAQWVEAKTSKRFSVSNPATGELLSEVADLGAEDARRAVEAADNAFHTWRERTAKDRAQLLRQWFELILAHQDDLARLMTAEQGKPLSEALGEVAYGASFVEWFAEEAKRLYGDVIPGPQKDKRILVLKQPVGVFAAITPWNFPLAMITRKVAPGLAAGCTAVIKPAEETPLTALALAHLAQEAGFPPGVLNVIPTNQPVPVGQELTGNPLVRKLSFTGSTEVGKKLMADSAATLKKLSLELGGNAPFVVFDDANLDSAVAGAMASKYRNAGQTCICANRFIVQAGVYEEFAQRLAAAAASLRVGSGLDSESTLGPLINEDAVEAVAKRVAAAQDAGAKALTGARRLHGTFYAPTVLTEVTTEMAIVTEEIFGPIAPLIRFEQETEALKIANDTPYGLAAYFYTQDADRIWRFAEQLDYGMVGVNEGLISTEVAPFGGVKESGLGREGSKYGIEEYVETKYLCLGAANPESPGLA